MGPSPKPGTRLRIEVVEVAEAAGEEEVLTDVSERAFDFPLRLRPMGTAGFRKNAAMTREVDQCAIVGVRF